MVIIHVGSGSSELAMVRNRAKLNSESVFVADICVTPKYKEIY